MFLDVNVTTALFPLGYLQGHCPQHVFEEGKAILAPIYSLPQHPVA